jgi:DNA topoisomerase IA
MAGSDLKFHILQVAEKLYQQGFLSYPRTETDQFDVQFEFMTLIQKQSVDPSWGPFATKYVTNRAHILGLNRAI